MDWGWDITSGHMGDYGTTKLNAAVAKALANFERNLRDRFGSPIVAPKVISGGASLITGGVFDIPVNGNPSSWRSPHCGHRDGNTLDISIRTLSPEYRQELADAFRAFKFNPLESPEQKQTTHWHAVIK